MSDDIRAIAYELSNSDGETIIIRSERHQVESYKHRYSTDLVNELVRKSEAQTQIAVRDAEIVRLREISELFSEYEKLMDSSEDVAGMVVYAELRKRVYEYEALKGGAA